MPLHTNVAHTPVQIGDGMEPTTVDIKLTVEDGSKLFALRQHMLAVSDDDGKDIVSVATGGGLGSDLVLIEYTTSDGRKLTGGFNMATLVAQFVEAVDPKAPQALLKTLRRES